MTVSEVYGVLRRVYTLKSRMNHYMTSIEELESLKTSIGSILPRTDIVQTSHDNGSRLDMILIDIDDIQDKFQKTVAEWKQSIVDAEDLINTLDDEVQKTILELRFIRGHKWEDIARETNYTADWVQRLKKRAIRDIARKNP